MANNSNTKRSYNSNTKRSYNSNTKRSDNSNTNSFSDKSAKRFIAVRRFKTGASIFGLVILFLLLASLTRRISNGTMPTFTGLLSYLSTFEKSSIPFNTNTGVGLLDFLTFIFSNAIQGFQIFFGIIKYLFFG